MSCIAVFEHIYCIRNSTLPLTPFLAVLTGADTSKTDKVNFLPTKKLLSPNSTCLLFSGRTVVNASGQLIERP